VAEALYTLFAELAAIDGVSGHEMEVARAIARHARESGADADVSADGVGNVSAVLRSDRSGPTLQIAAHMDEVGYLVKSVEPGGFIRLDRVGGAVPGITPTRLVRIAGRYTGVVGMRPGHLMTSQEQCQAATLRDLYVDVGATSAGEVAQLGIRVGDQVVAQQPPFRLAANPNRVGGKALDDRLGCAILLQLLRDGAHPPAGTLVLTFTVQEEVGLRGAEVSAARWNPDLALAVDTMPSGDTPDVNFHRELAVALGQGPAIQTISSRAILPPPVRDFLLAAAVEADVPVQLVGFPQGANDSAAQQWATTGRPAGSICIPRRYSHTPGETCDLTDAVCLYRLLAQTIQRLDSLPDFGFLAS
jgi:putative aminopeptidase